MKKRPAIFTQKNLLQLVGIIAILVLGNLLNNWNNDRLEQIKTANIKDAPSQNSHVFKDSEE